MNDPIIITTPAQLRAIIREELKALARAQPRPEPDEWITVTEFCIRRRKNPKTARNSIYKKCQEGKLPARMDGGEWQINWTEYCK